MKFVSSLKEWLKPDTPSAFFKRIWFFSAVYLVQELSFHFYEGYSLGVNILYPVLFALAYGLLGAALTGFPVKLVNRIVAGVLTAVSTIAFSLQLVYGYIFKTYISVYSIMQNAGDATEFWKEALDGIIACIPGIIILMIIPIVALVFAIKFGFAAAPLHAEVKKKNFMLQGCVFGLSVIVYLITVLLLPVSGRDEHTAYDLYHNNFILDSSVEKLGVMTSVTLDLKEVLFSKESTGTIEATTSLDLITPTATPMPTVAPTPTPAKVPDETSEPTPTPTPEPTPTPVDTSPNVLNIDFAKLAEDESNSEIKKLHEYFATVEPTKKNEYTGMFKGYNFIYLTCEGYSPWAVDEEVTPTLYKLTHSGFVFENFYNPIWYTSTSDGEYVECMGLLPYNSNSFKRSKNNSLPFCFGWQFLKLGYSCRAYHDHTATYYGRKDTHPNMGYIFKAKRAGLDVTDVWPESDLEMVQLSLPEYINDDHFHVYYMTVSGHLEYGFSDNNQARKNKDAVKDLPYSDEVKAYIACNVELDKALAYLLEELEKAGRLDDTVIAFGADHYPYGLSDEAINEVAGHEVDKQFELYKNNFVIWNSKIEEPIVIDKYCSSIDMMPTLSNLFGLEYDSRLFMGTDILSDSPALAIFSNQSFITDYCRYNASNKKVTMLQDVELPEGYISNVSKIVKNKFNASKSILLNDYYKYIEEFIPGLVKTVPESYDDHIMNKGEAKSQPEEELPETEVTP